MTAPLKRSDSVTVNVALDERAYDIVIGRDVLQSLGRRIAALRPGARTAIVTDRNVAKHWLEKTEASLVQAGLAASRIVVEEGEGSKTYAGLERVSEALIAARIERNDPVVALGGGEVGDLLPRQGGDRGPRRARSRRPRAAQSRPYLRPCAGGGDRLFRPAVSWRRRCHRHGAGGGIVRATRHDLGGGCRADRTSSCRG